LKLKDLKNSADLADSNRVKTKESVDQTNPETNKIDKQSFQENILKKKVNKRAQSQTFMNNLKQDLESGQSTSNLNNQKKRPPMKIRQSKSIFQAFEKIQIIEKINKSGNKNSLLEQ
jgi:hypothetical protein